MLNFDIITVGPAHASVLALIHHQCFDSAWTDASFRDSLATPGTLALVAKQNPDQAVGFVMLRAAVDEAEILTIATLPMARRQGVGKTLMNAAENRLIMLKIKIFFLEVAEDNLAAQSLYENLGFAIKGRRQGYYDRPSKTKVDALIMSKML